MVHRRSAAPHRIADHRLAVRARHAALLLSLLLPLPAMAAGSAGGETPQAVVARMRTAVEKDDFPGVVDCIAPAQRREMAAGLVLGTTMMVAFLDFGSNMAAGMAEGMSEAASDGSGGPTAEQKAEVAKAKAEADGKILELRTRHEAILERYGLKKRMDEMQAETKVDGSPEEAMARLLAGVDDRALIADLMGFMEALGKSQGKGETSKPMQLPPEITDYQVDGDQATAKAGEETVRFVKVEGRWYLVPEEKKGPAS